MELAELRQFRDTKYFATRDGDIIGPKGKRKVQTNPDGYLTINLWYNGRDNFQSVHRFIKEAFDGVSELEIDHKDGDKTNNALSNLEYVSHEENCKRRSNTKLPYYVQSCNFTNERAAYRYVRTINGKQVTLKQSVNLDTILKFKEQYEK